MKRTTPWLRSARQWTEIGWTAPWVIGERISRLSAASFAPTAADRRELHRMVDEKVVAAAQAQLAYWQRMWLEQYRIAWSWWTSSWLDSARMSPARRWKHTLDRVERAAARSTSASLTPVQRRVRANAKRLRRR